ncbi:MAG: response regulator [Myxococcaceae bacterium]|nr:response regulator [Myxococcaceae bacterium]
MTPNLATFVSMSAFVALVGMGVVFTALARGPRWANARIYTVIAFSAAAYSAVDVCFTLPELNGELVRSIGVLNYLTACIHACAWVVHAFSTPEHPWRDLSPRLRVVVIITMTLGVVALVPHVMNTDGVHEVRVAWAGVVYHQPETTIFADLMSVWVLGVLALPLVAFVRAYRRGERGRGVWVVSFTIFLACGISEALTTNGVYDFLFLGDVGLLAMVLSVLVDSVRQVRRDAQALEAFGQDLAAQVERRTLERDEARTALQHAERLAALGRLAAGVGHEINNPLSYVRSNLRLLHEALAHGKLPDDAGELLEESIEGTERIRRVVSDLRSYALPVDEQRRVLDLREVLSSALKVAAHQLRHIAPVTQEHGPDVPGVVADPLRLGQVFVNLLVNAGHAVREANRDPRRIVVRTRRAADGRAVIEVQDSGVGMPPELLARLGEPYFSTRIDRGGTGLGLFVSRGIVASFGGTLDFESTVGVGTVARVTLPGAPAGAAVATAAPVTAPTPEPAPPPTKPLLAGPAAGRRPRALIVDDEPAVARAFSRMLSDFEVTILHDAQAAARMLTERPSHFDLVLCDVMMPGMTGAQLHAQLEREAPALLPRFVFVTGGTMLPEVSSFLGRAGIHHLTKPFDREALVAASRAALERSAAAQQP